MHTSEHELIIATAVADCGSHVRRKHIPWPGELTSFSSGNLP
jgi:hypothetical protein